MSSNLWQHVGVSCPRTSTCLTLPCPCLNQRCCVSKLGQVYTPLGQLLTFPARSFGSDAHITNSHHKSTTRGRSSLSAGTLAQYTSMLAAQQDKDAEFWMVFHASFIFLLWSSSVRLLLDLFTSNSAVFIRYFPHFTCVFPRSDQFSFLLRHAPERMAVVASDVCPPRGSCTRGGWRSLVRVWRLWWWSAQFRRMF